MERAATFELSWRPIWRLAASRPNPICRSIQIEPPPHFQLPPPPSWPTSWRAWPLAVGSSLLAVPCWLWAVGRKQGASCLLARRFRRGRGEAEAKAEAEAEAKGRPAATSRQSWPSFSRPLDRRRGQGGRPVQARDSPRELEPAGTFAATTEAHWLLLARQQLARSSPEAHTQPASTTELASLAASPAVHELASSRACQFTSLPWRLVDTRHWPVASVWDARLPLVVGGEMKFGPICLGQSLARVWRPNDDSAA